ncbi:MAG: hypothetical protein Q9164_007039 [Protoblastenia rupestris]
MEVDSGLKPDANGKPEEVIVAATETENNPTSQSTEKEQLSEADTEKKVEDLEKKVPVSAHQRERDENPSARVKEGKRWNDRDRHRHGQQERYTPNKFVRNNKFDPTSLPESDDPAAIRKQVEFYFSDSNLLTDKFLFTKMEGHENVPVPIDVIHSFKRMRHFQPRSAVVTALKESKVLHLVNDDNDIQRREPLPEGLVGKPMNEIQQVHEDSSMARSVYAKGFGQEEASTQFDIEALFANYGSTNSVRLRRHENRIFKGSVFVEFDNEETAKNFLAIDPPPMYKGKKLQLKSKKQYCDDKVEDIKAGRVRPNSADGRDKRGGFRGGRRNNDHRDLDKHDDRDWRLRREEDAKEGFPGRRNGGSKADREDRRDGKRNGFGSSGRGRGGRGGRGRDRNEERKAREERSSSKDLDVKDASQSAKDTEEVTAGMTETTAVPESSEAPEEQIVPESATKKRAREDDEETEGQPEVKKVDVKEE